MRNPMELIAPADVELTKRADGTLVLRSRQPLLEYPSRVGAWLEHWAAKAPNRSFLLQRSPTDQWQGVTYAEALAKVRRIASWLLQQRSADVERLFSDSPAVIHLAANPAGAGSSWSAP